MVKLIDDVMSSNELLSFNTRPFAWFYIKPIYDMLII
jgi:hypothetical protein